MQPFERASEESRRRTDLPINYAKKAATAVGGAAIANRIVPFLSKYIPENLATKGLNKVSHKLGNFIKKAGAMGFDFDETRDFIGEKLTGGIEQEPAKEDRNIIQQYSPELHQFIDQEVKKGRKPIEAGALAQSDKRFKKIISQLEKDHKTPWSSILESVYGGVGMAQPQQQQMQQPQQSQQTGPGQQALMQMLQQINQRVPGAGGQQ